MAPLLPRLPSLDAFWHWRWCTTRENTHSIGAELAGAQKSFITPNTKIHKILLSCGFLIHIKARMLKAKTSKPRTIHYQYPWVIMTVIMNRGDCSEGNTTAKAESISTHQPLVHQQPPWRWLLDLQTYWWRWRCCQPRATRPRLVSQWREPVQFAVWLPGAATSSTSDQSQLWLLGLAICCCTVPSNGICPLLSKKFCILSHRTSNNNNYCWHAIADGNQRIRIREKTLESLSVIYTVFVPRHCLHTTTHLKNKNKGAIE